MNDPEHVIIMGDVHGNYLWVSSQLKIMRDMLPNEDPLIVLQLGDWGWWPQSSFSAQMAKIANDLNMRIWVTPGNHEDYSQVYSSFWRSNDPASHHSPVVALDRGTRWRWHDRMWLSVGGAVSPDRDHRIPGVSWWPEEELQSSEVDLIIAAGPADVLLTHDVGLAVPLPLGPWPLNWGEKTYRSCQNHRQLIQLLADDVKPQWWYHGHMHLSKQQTVNMPHGEVEVTSLDMDGESKNWGILNTKTMKFESWNDASRDQDWDRVIKN